MNVWQVTFSKNLEGNPVYVRGYTIENAMAEARKIVKSTKRRYGKDAGRFTVEGISLHCKLYEH